MVPRSFVYCLIVGALLALFLMLDKVYFGDVRESYKGGTITEAFIRNGSLGRLLRKGNFLSIDPETASFATNDMCATDEELRGFDYHNAFRMRLKLISSKPAELAMSLIVRTADGKETHHQKRFLVDPGQYYYALTFKADISDMIELEFRTAKKGRILLCDIVVDGRFGRNLPLLVNGRLQKGSFDKPGVTAASLHDPEMIGVVLEDQSSPLMFHVSQREAAKLYSGLFPGKKNQGYCKYSANIQSNTGKESVGAVVPTIRIWVDEEDFTGETGILSNKERKGKAWEVPAELEYGEGSKRLRQAVGLRFHGGGIGRTKYTESFRVYARQRYGNSELKPELLFGRYREKALRTVVLKYTYQAYYEQRQDFNPFNHAFALDIADAIGALVPSHGLVDLHVNNEHKGLYLAMEHLSDKTVRNWLGHDDFKTYVYRKDNPPENDHLYSLLLAQVRLRKGKDAYESFKLIFNEQNVINSILLSIFIADDDFCQGIEVMNTRKGTASQEITTVNWDLDHAFLTYNNGVFTVDPERSTMFLLNMPTGHDYCHKRYMYAWLYDQSPVFRRNLRLRMEELAAHELSPDYLSRLLDPYREINEHYFEGKHENAISDLEKFIQKRTQIVLNHLRSFEEQHDLAAATP